MKIVDFSAYQNPDSGSLALKRQPSIELSSADISASAYTSSMDKIIQLNYYKNGIVIDIDRYKDVHSGTTADIPEGFEIPHVAGTIYYTPLYTEKINYETWVNTVNRNFQELN